MIHEGIHAGIHAGDFIRYDSCAPWLTSEGRADMRDAGYSERDFNEKGFEKWARKRADAEYFNTFGVRSPDDPKHQVAAHNKPLSCLFDR